MPAPNPPEGRFVLGESTAPIVAFAGGSGITPVISLLKTVLVGTKRAVKLVYANQDRDAIIFREELDVLAEREPDRMPSPGSSAGSQPSLMSRAGD